MVRRDTGEEMPSGYEIIELAPPALLVLSSDPMPEYGMPEPVITRVELRDVGDGRTRTELIDRLYREASATPRRWKSSFERLGAYLAA